MTGAAERIVERAGRIADRAPSTAELAYHRVELIAARRLRALGRPVPPELVAQERSAAVAALAAPALLRRVRESADGPLLLVKGPEAARHYPDPSLRDFRDLDLIVPDAQATQRQLVGAGFEEVGEPWVYEGIHHLRPLHWPGLPLVVEVHHSPKWLDHVEPPPAESLLRAAVSRPDGLLVLPPAHHALLLAAHGWAHRPLTRLRDLLDVALVALAANPAEVDRLASAWRARRMWRTTARAVEAVLDAGRRPVSVAVWARHLEGARERTVLESHLQRSLSDLWGLPRDRLLAAGDGVRGILVPEPGESWPNKLARTRAAVGNAFAPKSQHDRMLKRKEDDGPASTAEPPARVA